MAATIHAFLRNSHEDIGNEEEEAANTVHYGPSTNNRVTNAVYMYVIMYLLLTQVNFANRFELNSSIEQNLPIVHLSR